MTKIARLNDRTLGDCSEHGPGIGGKIITGSPDIEVNGRPLARVGDKVLADCGHIAQIVTGSATEIGNDRLVARLNDRVGKSPYTAKIVTASPDTEAK